MAVKFGIGNCGRSGYQIDDFVVANDEGIEYGREDKEDGDLDMESEESNAGMDIDLEEGTGDADVEAKIKVEEMTDDELPTESQNIRSDSSSNITKADLDRILEEFRRMDMHYEETVVPHWDRYAELLEPFTNLLWANLRETSRKAPSMP